MEEPSLSLDSTVSSRAFTATGVALLGIQGAFVLANPTHFLFDDAYFYLQIASHLVAGDGSTFHGLGWTNGYHPLWLAICVPIVALAKATGLSALRLAIFADVLLAGGILVLLRRLVGKVGVPYPVLALAIAAMYFLAGGVWVSEGMLNGFLQVAALNLLVDAHRDRASLARWVVTGAVLGLAVLARLDLVFLGAACCFSALLQPGVPLRDRVRDTLATGLALTLVLCPYLASNLVATGHLMPISGATKSTFPVPDLTDLAGKLGSVGRNALVAAMLCGLLGAAGSGERRRLLWVVGGATIAHGLYVGLFTAPRWSTDYDYYYVTGAFGMALVASEGFAWFTRLLPSFDAAARQRLALGLAALLMAAAVGQVAARSLAFTEAGLGRRPEPSTVALGRWLGHNLPADARVFTVDAPGRLAWFSGLPVLAADGLTNDWDFADEITAAGLDGWLARRGITHVVGPLFDYPVPWANARYVGGRTSLSILAPHTGESTGTLQLREEEALLLTDALDPTTLPDERVGVWTWEAVR